MTLTDITPVRDRVHWQSVLEALDEVVLLLDPGHVITYASPSVRARLGYAPEDVAGQGLGDLAHPDDLGDALRSVAGLRLGGPVRHAMRVRRADAGYLLLEWSVTKIADDAGGDLVVLAGRDGCPWITVGERSASVHQPAVPQQPGRARTAAGLTPREHEVLERLAAGEDAAQIARELALSVYSVRGHIKSLLRKLGVHSQLQAVVVATRRGIVDLAATGTAGTAPD